MSRPTPGLVGRIALAATILLASMLIAPAAGHAISIESSGPVTEIAISPELRCNARYAGNESYEFFPSGTAAGSCGPIVTRGSQSVSFGAFVPVSQSAQPLGRGTSADPLRVVTTVCVGAEAECANATAPLLTQTVRYVIGEDFYRTDLEIVGRGGAETLGIYQYGDCYLQDSDVGFGFYDADRRGIYCAQHADNAPPGRIEGFVPISPASSYYESSYSTVLTRIVGQPGVALPNTCDCAVSQDNGMALAWTGIALPASGSARRSFLTAFSPVGVAVDPAPAVTLNAPAQDSQITDATPVFAGDAGDEPGDLPTVTVELYAGSSIPATSPLRTLGATRAGASWSVEDAAALAPGIYTARARQLDNAGNAGISEPRTFSVIPPPALPPAAPPPAAPPLAPLPDDDGDAVDDAADNCADAANADQADRDDDGIGDRCDSSDATRGPKVAERVVAEVVGGTVFVRPPGLRKAQAGASAGAAQAPAGFRPLKGAEVLPVGTVVDSRRGRLGLTSSAGSAGGRSLSQRAEFFDGIFKIRQRRGKRPDTEILLQSASFTQVCGSSARAAAQPAGPFGVFAARTRLRSKKVSRLWGSGKGRYRTIGRNSVTTVRGTIWLTEERCDGTLTRVSRGSVAVRDTNRDKTFTVRSGHSYLARAIRATIKTRGR